MNSNNLVEERMVPSLRSHEPLDKSSIAAIFFESVMFEILFPHYTNLIKPPCDLNSSETQHGVNNREVTCVDYVEQIFLNVIEITHWSLSYRCSRVALRKSNCRPS